MTDFTSREVVYYTADMYNNTSANIEAQIDVSLQYPLVQQGNNYNVGISKAQFDLSTIPLTRNNIPLRKYEVAIKNGQAIGSAFVRQLNASDDNFCYNLDPATGIFSKSTYNFLSGIFTPISTFTIPSNVATKFGAMVVDNYENVFLATNTTGSSIFNTLTILSPTGAVISQTNNPLVLNNIVALSMNPDQILCIASNDFTGSKVNIEQVTSTIGPEGPIVTLTPITSLVQNNAGVPFTDIKTVAIDLAHIIIGYNDVDCTLFDAQTFIPLNDFQVSELTGMGSASAILSESNRFVLTDSNTADYLYGFLSGAVVNTSGETLKQAGVLDSPSLSNVVYTGPEIGVVYGVKSNQIYSLPYTDGDLGALNLVSAGPVVSVGVDAQGSIYGINGADLKYLNLNGVSPGITQVACSDIQVAGASTQVFFQPGSNTAYAISGGNLYTSNQIAPKLIFSSTTVGNITNINKYSLPPSVLNATQSATLLAQYPISIAGATLPLQCLGICKQSGLGTQPYFSLYIDSANVAPNTFLLKQNATTFATEGTLSITTPVQTQTQGVNLFEIEGLGIGVVMTNEDHAYVQIYDYNLAPLLTDTSIEISPGSDTSASSWTVGINQYILLTNQSFIYVFFVAFLSPNVLSSELVSEFALSTINITGLPSGATLSSVDAVLCFNDVSNVGGYFIGTSSASTGSSDLFGTFSYTDTTFATLSELSVISVGSYSDYLAVNKSLGEVYFKNTTGSINIWNTSAQQITPIISATTPQIGVMFVPEVIDGTFAWQSQAITGIPSIDSLCFSQQNPNKMYVVNASGDVPTDNLLYQTNVNVPAPYSFTRVPDTPNKIDSISCGLPTTINLNGTAYCYNIQDGQKFVESFNIPGTEILSIGKNRGFSGDTKQGEFLVSLYHDQIVGLAPTDFLPSWQNPFPTAGFIYLKPGQDVYAGDVSIYDYDTLVQQINQAFSEAYLYMGLNGGSGMIEPPVMSIDPVTTKLILTYAAPYYASGNGILLNNALLQLCKFPSTPVTSEPGLGMNRLLLPESSEPFTQPSRSIYIFNQLDQILLVSNTIFVIGSLYGNNLQNNILQDFSVPISDQSGNQGVVLYVQPNFVSTLTIGSNQAIQRIQLRVLYKYKDETTYPLLLAPNSNWSAKMMFIKKY
jgi:hypothetical protein